eukprot:763535-Pleurochrysis_carterae.AAC.1
MSCGDNPEANLASNNNTDTPDAGQRESAGPNLSGRTSWLPEPVHVPPPPLSLTEEIRRVLLALREEEAGQ